MFVVMCEIREVETFTSPVGVKMVNQKSIMYPIASYSSEDEAVDWGLECTKLLHGRDRDTTRFLVIETEHDVRPRWIEDYKQKVEEIKDYNDETLKSLMDKGVIDQLIGEDGEFYYDLTEKGRAVADKYGINPKNYPKKSE